MLDHEVLRNVLDNMVQNKKKKINKINFIILFVLEVKQIIF